MELNGVETHETSQKCFDGVVKGNEEMEFYLFKINVTGSANFFLNCRWFLPSAARKIANRINDIQRSHGINSAELLRLLPNEWNWSLATVTTPRQLVDSLTPTQFAWFANEFQVEREWLEGTSDITTKPFWGYKNPKHLIDSLDSAGWNSIDLRMTILAEDYTGNDSPLSRYAIALSTPIAKLEDTGKIVWKHALFEGEWHWHHWPCRRDTKAIVRWYSMHLHRFGVVPIVPISNRNFERLTTRKHLLASFIPDCSAGFDHMEDRVLLPRQLPHGESMRAIETDELPHILDYARQSGIVAS